MPFHSDTTGKFNQHMFDPVWVELTTKPSGALMRKLEFPKALICTEYTRFKKFTIAKS